MKERFITSTVLQNGEDMHTWTVKDQDFLISGGLKRRKVEQKEDVFHESVYLSIGMPRTLISLRINGREWEAHNEKIEVYLDQTSIKSVIECMNELLECLKDNMEGMR